MKTRFYKRRGRHSLAFRTILALLAAILLAQAASYAILSGEHRQTVSRLMRENLMHRIASVVRLLEETPAELHRTVLSGAGSPVLHYMLSPTPLLDPGDARTRTNVLAGELSEALADTRIQDVLLSPRSFEDGHHDPGWNRHDRPERHHRLPRQKFHPRVKAGFLAAIRLEDGRWLNVRAGLAPALAPGLIWNFTSLGLTAILIALATIVIIRRITRPLRRLAVASDRLGRGEAVAPLPETGPEDLRRTTQAFNRMNERLNRFVNDRMAMLAAISHDLRSPVTALRLRAEMVEDEETRNRMIATLDEIQDMVQALLQFAREDASREDTRTVDLAALAESLCLELAEAGAEVTFRGGPSIAYPCRPTGLKRAFRNLIENAVRYGRRARVSLEDGPVLVVEDDGPGIPEDAMERLFKPFVRLEDSRNRETGGVGLGLTIARTVARAHGGDVRLRNRPDGGLRAEIRLPGA